jgi:23S rRNA (guanosine2251-2'-O)-methyltransferase
MDLICGINPVVEALSAGRRHFDRLLVVKGLRNRRVSEAIARASQLGVPLRFETRETLDRLSTGVPHQGIIAVVSPKPAIDVEDLLRGAHDPALVVVLDGVEDPRNLGAILRTVESAGADGVLLPERNNAGLSETVNRASAGALEHVKVARIGNVSQTLESLKQRGIWVVGLDAGGRRWDKIDFKRPIALVLGGEGRGLRRLVRENCDELAALPLFGHVTSLNVSVAAGAVLYEVVRQRGTMPSNVRPIPPQSRPPAVTHVTGPEDDDLDLDPGRDRRRVANVAPDESEDDTAPASLSLVEIHDGEEAAWHLPPTAPPPPRVPRENRERKEGRPEARPGGPARGERRGRAEGQGEAAASPERSHDRPADGPRGRRRRKRHGRRPNEGGAEPRQMPSADASALPPPQSGEAAPASGNDDAAPSGNPSTNPSTNGEASTPRHGRRRRRRRR